MPLISPNRVTATRLALIPVLWALALLERTTALGVLLAFAALTDVADGILARRLRMTSRFGSRLDTVADLLLIVSTLAWLAMLRPELMRENAVWLTGWLALAGAGLLVGWVRFGRVADLHLYTAKAAGLLGFAFAVHTLVVERYSRTFFFVSLAVASLAALEMLLVMVTRRSVDEHVGSVLLASGKRRSRG